MSYAITTPSTVLPVSIDEIRKHLRITHTSEDDLLEMYALAAVDRFEEASGLVLMSKTFRLSIDAFPSGDIRLRRCPVTSVSAIDYRDSAGVMKAVAIDDLYIDSDSRPARIAHKLQQWPSVMQSPAAVLITFVAGHATADLVPRIAKVALLMMIAHWYEHREEVSDIRLDVVPNAVQTIINLCSFREL